LRDKSIIPGVKNHLGEMYLRGEGVDKNYKNALNWFLKAANGFSSELVNWETNHFATGLAYDDGQGGVTFFEEAEKSFRKALKQEVRDAQYNLGKMYENGHGVTQNDKEAVKWYRKAADQGDPYAAQSLKKLLAKLGIHEKQLPKTSRASDPSGSLGLQFKKSETRPDDIAVIIGNSDYEKQGRDIPNVKPAYADAEGFKQWVTQAKGVREGNIIYVKDATSAQIVSVFGNETSHKGKLFNWTKPNISNVYVYYAGHGAPAGERNKAYLVPTDADTSTIELTGYPLATLYKNLRRLPAKSITVVIESCFSGASQSGNIIPRTSGLLVTPRVPNTPKNITVISAGRADQIASWEQDDSHSLFTKYFLMGMSGKADDTPYGNNDGDVTYKELGKYLDGTMTYCVRR
jgi:hypothetical protein